MTKQDYIKLASVLNNAHRTNQAFDDLVESLAVMLKDDNPDFDPDKFCEAVFARQPRPVPTRTPESLEVHAEQAMRIANDDPA